MSDGFPQEISMCMHDMMELKQQSKQFYISSAAIQTSFWEYIHCEFSD